MNKEDNLVGRLVTLYLSGGWEVTGYVESASEKKIVIKDADTNELYLSFMDKVSCLRINSENSRLRPINPKPPNISAAKNYSQDDEFPMNKISYDDSGMSIPQGLLKDLPDKNDDDFSISFGSKDDVNNGMNSKGGIEFRIHDDSQEKD